MKTSGILLSLFLFILFSSSKAQVLLINGHFLNSNNRRIKANYNLTHKGKIIYTGRDTEDLLFDVNFNEIYSLTVSQEGFKTKTIVFCIKPETIKDKFLFEFDVNLKEKYDLQNIYVDDHSKVEYNYDCGEKTLRLITGDTNSLRKSLQ